MPQLFSALRVLGRHTVMKSALAQEARHIEEHLLLAMRMGRLCSNDPICAHHTPGTSLEKRWLHGAAFFGAVV